jgi:DDE superfamily endonuclease
MLLVLRRWYPQREIVTVADRAYASLKLLDRCRKLSEPITFVTRLRLDAALYEPAPPRRPGQRGRPRLKGERLPDLSEVAEDPKTVWEPITIANWYGSEQRTVEVASATAVWYSTGLPTVSVRWVLIRDPQKEFKTQTLLCTDLNADPQKFVKQGFQASPSKLLTSIARNFSAEVRISVPSPTAAEDSYTFGHAPL